MNVRTRVANIETLDEDVAVSTIYNNIVEIAITGYDGWTQMDVAQARAVAAALLAAADAIVETL